MMCSRSDHDRGSSGRPGLARMAAAARLGSEAGGLDTVRHCGSAGGDPRCRQPMGQPWPYGRCGRVASPTAARSIVKTEPAATCPVASAAGAGCRGLWLSWGHLDGSPRHRTDSPPIRRAVPLQSRRQSAARGWLESSEATAPRQSTQRSGHRAVADRALASAKKGAAREGRTVVWVDESGFALLPAVVRSLAPRGHPPMLRFPFTRDHLSVISGITPSGRLLLRVQDHAFRSPEVVSFLQHLPGYAPDLNPDEGIWAYLKYVELRNVCCTDLHDLQQHLRLATARLRHKRHVIRSLISHAGYAV